MNALEAPIYEIRQDSDWFKSEIKRREDIKSFFKEFIDKYGTSDGFSFYAEYFGVYPNSPAYEIFKESLTKNQRDGFYPFKKRTQHFKEIRSMLVQIEETDPFKTHDVFGMNNVVASQWLNGRWFFQVRKEDFNNEEVSPITYKEYLKLVMDSIE